MYKRTHVYERCHPNCAALAVELLQANCQLVGMPNSLHMGQSRSLATDTPASVAIAAQPVWEALLDPPAAAPWQARLTQHSRMCYMSSNATTRNSSPDMPTSQALLQRYIGAG